MFDCLTAAHVESLSSLRHGLLLGDRLGIAPEKLEALEERALAATERVTANLVERGKSHGTTTEPGTQCSGLTTDSCGSATTCRRRGPHQMTDLGPPDRCDAAENRRHNRRSRRNLLCMITLGLPRSLCLVGDLDDWSSTRLVHLHQHQEDRNSGQRGACLPRCRRAQDRSSS